MLPILQHELAKSATHGEADTDSGHSSSHTLFLEETRDAHFIIFNIVLEVHCNQFPLPQQRQRFQVSRITFRRLRCRNGLCTAGSSVVYVMLHPGISHYLYWATREVCLVGVAWFNL